MRKSTNSKAATVAALLFYESLWTFLEPDSRRVENINALII